MANLDSTPRHFAYVVDGEVAHIQSLHPEIHPLYEQLVAVMSSNPKVIEINPSVGFGDLYDEATGTFSPKPD